MLAIALLSMDKVRVKQKWTREPAGQETTSTFWRSVECALNGPHSPRRCLGACSILTRRKSVWRLSGSLHHVRGLRSFLAFGNFELYLVALLQALVSL